jgi:hypothetical protein
VNANKGIYRIKESGPSTDSWFTGAFQHATNSWVCTSPRVHPISNKIYIGVAQNPGSKVGFLILDSASYSGLGLGPASGANSQNLKYLDGNKVKAAITNRGDRFWDFTSARYEVPKGSGKNSAFASSIWLGGLDLGGNLHVAAQTYRQFANDFWPGPLDTTNAGIDSATATLYDKVWKIDKQMIYDFQQNFSNGNVQNGTWEVPEDILTWPAHGSMNQAYYLAPFTDVNGDGNYDPLGSGDHPKIKGDMSIYSIFNDKLAPHTETGGLPLGVEIHYEAYSFNCDLVPDSLKVLNYTTFHDYTIINRSSTDLDSVWVGLFHDAQIGHYLDDMASCKPSENFAMVYNGDGLDDYAPGAPGYGNEMPISSSVILQGPKAYPLDGKDNNNNGISDETGEECLLTNFVSFREVGWPGPTFMPATPDEYYNYMRSIWPDSTHFTECGSQIGAVSDYCYPFDPYLPSPCGGPPPAQSDVRMIPASGPFQLTSGEKVHFTEAVVFTSDTTLPYYMGTGQPFAPDLFQLNENNILKIKNWYATNTFPSCYLWQSVNENVSGFTMEVFPNPANNLLNVNFSEEIRYIEITDLNGKLCLLKNYNQHSNSTKVGVENLFNGIYFLKVSGASGNAFKKFIVAR